MTDFSKKLFLNDLAPALPPENGETNLYQSAAGYLVSHGPAGVLREDFVPTPGKTTSKRRGNR